MASSRSRWRPRGPDGVLTALDETSVRDALTACGAAAVESVAVCLLFSFRHPEHERRVGELAAEAAEATANRRATIPAGNRSTLRARPTRTYNPRTMPIALKEWAVTVRALAEGEQLITLRKGGIREENKHFEVAHRRFFLYPTFDHQQASLVRESHIPELKRALEDGVWHPPAPTARMMEAGLPVAQPVSVRLRAWAEVAESWEITAGNTLDKLAPFHVWTSDYATKRFDWKPRHPLHVLLLRTYRIPRPVTIKVREEYVGCRSWVDVARDLPFEGTPVLSDSEFASVRADVEQRIAKTQAA
ncbi:MAG: DUF1802 family protein [Solirubrobacterales bacterium]